jgi:hypothetical protein
MNSSTKERNRGEMNIRQHIILSRLAVEGRSLSLSNFKDLQEDFGVNRKTMRRYLDVLTKVPAYNVERNTKLSATSKAETTWCIKEPISFINNPCPVITEKRCSTCRQVYPVEDFSRDSNTRDGYAARCRCCLKKARSKRRKIATKND